MTSFVARLNPAAFLAMLALFTSILGGLIGYAVFSIFSMLERRPRWRRAEKNVLEVTE